jgi:pyridoxamine 5'-phosphate oxidase family protein
VSVFTQQEAEYLQQNRLCRIATVGRDGQPHVTPVGYHYDPETRTVGIGSRDDCSATKKFKDVVSNPLVTLVIDDFASLDPPSPRGIEIRGRAEPLTQGGEQLGQLIWGVDFQPAWIRITPTRIVSWGIDTPFNEFSSRSV